MKKKQTYFLSRILAVVLALAMLPPVAVSAAADAAYSVLLQPSAISSYLGSAHVEEKKGDLATVTTENGQYIIKYTSSGIQKISDNYGMIFLVGHGYASMCVEDERTGMALWGLIDSSGHVVIEPKYGASIEITEDGYALGATPFSAACDVLELSTGDVVATVPWTSGADDDGIYCNGLMPKYKGGQAAFSDNVENNKSPEYQYVNLNGSVIIPGPFKLASAFSNGYAVTVVGNDVYRIINTNGSTVFQSNTETYGYIGSASSEGLFVAQKGEYWGYLDVTGREVIPFEYLGARDFYNGYAVVYNRNYDVGMIDTKGNIIVPFGTYTEISDASDTGIVWGSEGYDGSTVSVLRVGENSGEYIYDQEEEEYVIPDSSISVLDKVDDQKSAENAVKQQVNRMTDKQKENTIGIDLATLYAETAVAKAASKKVTGKDILINADAVSDLEAVAAQTSAAVDTALVNGGVSTARYIADTVTLVTEETGEISIRIDPDVLTTEADKVRVETPTYAITINLADLAEDLTEILTFTTEDVGSGFATGKANGKTTVKVTMPKGKTTNPITVSLPKSSGNTTYQAVVKTDGTATASKYNPATTKIDGKVSTSGSYTVQVNEKDFTDISKKSAEMQKAIRYLASKGIINGTTATTFSPDGSINRAEIAALLVRALGKLNSGATTNFKDVSKNSWYYSAAASSQKCGLINGYPDNTFRGTTAIAKEQIVTVAGRVLVNEMKYKQPGNASKYLGKYKDSVATWAQPMVALATKENLVVYRSDGKFLGAQNMTRGDAAIIIYRLFQKIW